MDLLEDCLLEWDSFDIDLEIGVDLFELSCSVSDLVDLPDELDADLLDLWNLLERLDGLEFLVELLEIWSDLSGNVLPECRLDLSFDVSEFRVVLPELSLVRPDAKLDLLENWFDFPDFLGSERL